MTQVKRRIGDYASSKFLNSQDVLRVGPGPATITSVGEREVMDEKSAGGKRLALMIEFDRWPDKGYDCNTTNIRVLQDMLGEDVTPDDLRGVRVYITTHETKFGRGILFQPPQDTMQHASAAARQSIADSRERDHAAVSQPLAKPTLRLTHSHAYNSRCEPQSCDVARAKSLGHGVDEHYPDEQPAAPEEPAEFVPQHQPSVSHAAKRADVHVVGSGPQAQTQHGQSDAPPGQYHENDPGALGPIPEEIIPF